MTIVRDTLGEYLAEHDPVEALWHRLAEIVGEGPIGPAIETLSVPAATIYLVVLFEGEVDQGGFRRFLTDPSGDLAPQTRDALARVGAHVSLELLEKAMTVFPKTTWPSGHEARLSILARSEAEEPILFDPFDELYQQHVDPSSSHRLENIHTLLLDYLKENASEMVKG